MTTTATYSGLARRLRGHAHDAVALSAAELAFPAGGSATCPPAAESVRRVAKRLIVRMRTLHSHCHTGAQMFTVTVTIDRPVLRDFGLRAVDVRYHSRPQHRLALRV